MKVQRMHLDGLIATVGKKKENVLSEAHERCVSECLYLSVSERQRSTRTHRGNSNLISLDTNLSMSNVEHKHNNGPHYPRFFSFNIRHSPSSTSFLVPVE